MLHGGGVTSTDSAIVDEHWPTFDGAWRPDFGRMLENGYLLLEHSHRLIMATVGVLVVICAIALLRIDRQRVIARRLGTLAAALVAVVSVLGGLTVLLGKWPPASVVHVALAMLVVVALWSLVIVTGPWWFAAEARGEPRATKRLLGFASAALVAVYVQVVLGAIPRHATQEFGGRAMVLIGDAIHIVFALVVFATIVLAYLEVGRRYRKVGPLMRPAMLLVLLVVGQVILGVVTFMEQPKDPPSQADLMVISAAEAPGRGGAATDPSSESPRPAMSHVASASAHQAVGFVMLIASLFLTLRAARIHELSRRESGGGFDGDGDGCEGCEGGEPLAAS